jgi:hypothetical protein
MSNSYYTDFRPDQSDNTHGRMYRRFLDIHSPTHRRSQLLKTPEPQLKKAIEVIFALKFSHAVAFEVA